LLGEQAQPVVISTQLTFRWSGFVAKLIGSSSVQHLPNSASRGTPPKQPELRYLPPPTILKKLIRRQKGADGKEIVTMSVQTFHKLLETAITGLFDDRAYLEKFSDIRTAVRSGTIPSGTRHFVTDGFFEGRAPLKYDVDEDWYVRTYPDVALAIKTGKVRDGTEHFALFGFMEGRVPNRDLQKTIAEWRDLEKKQPVTG
jgi:hypothetical protein